MLIHIAFCADIGEHHVPKVVVSSQDGGVVLVVTEIPRIEMSEFLNNAHLRLVTVGDIEVHLQGLSFNAIECDEIGSAHVSFVPIKPGIYPLYVGNVPLAVGRPIGESGVQTQGQFIFRSIKVR